jgi:nickel superoxide dismutase
MSLLNGLLRLVDRLSPPAVAEAHCDIPCGIYDPHAAQVAALTIVRMVQLTEGQEKPDGSDKAATDKYDHTLSRYTAVKEDHGKIVEHEIETLWADYFRPEHLEKYPNLHDLVWKTIKSSAAARQQVSMQAAQDTLAGCQQIAELFWDSKGVKTKRQPSNQPAGGEIVYPVAG